MVNGLRKITFGSQDWLGLFFTCVGMLEQHCGVLYYNVQLAIDAVI